MTNNKPILTLDHVSMQFGGLRAVDDVSLVINEKEIFSVIGPNGAGKTTVFNLITGVYTPTSGNILFEDKVITKMKTYERTRLGIARTFQNIRLFKQLSVLDNIILAMHSKRDIGLVVSILRLPQYYKEKKNIIAKAESMLAYIGMLDIKNEKAENLPYGKQRELEIIRALATGAQLLLLDEPAAGMNPNETVTLMHLITKLRDELGKTILLIEHDMKLVMGISNRVAVLDYGKKIIEGLPHEVRNDPKVIEAYLGVEAVPANLKRGEDA